MSDKIQYPCATCDRVKDPKACENKNCKAWKEWFLYKWQEMHCNCKVEGKDK